MEEHLLSKGAVLKIVTAPRKALALASILLICSGAAALAINILIHRGGEPLPVAAASLGCSTAAPLLGCKAPLIKKLKDVTLHGTLIANDKSKGVTWMLDLDTESFRSIELPFNTGNHETAVSQDGLKVAVPHYEEVTKKGQNEGGGLASGKVSIIDIKTGISSVLASAPNPLGAPKPHDAAWLKDGSLLVTAQLANGFTKFFPNGSSIAFTMDPSRCNTPHLVRLIPDSNLAVSGCRCTNAGCKGSNGHADGAGHMVIFDTDTGEYNSFRSGKNAEGITVTGDGDVWIGSESPDHSYGFVQIFSFGGRPKTIHNIKELGQRDVPSPLRLAWNAEANTVAVASMDLAGVMAGDPDVHNRLRIFDAASRRQLKELRVTTARGAVNAEGLGTFASEGVGYFVTGGFDTQTIVILEAATGETVWEIYMPRCSTEKGLCTPTPKTIAEAQKDKETGSNNWSGGLCPATMRNPFERRWAVMDGFTWSPVRANCV